MHTHRGRRNIALVATLLGLLLAVALPASTPGSITRTARAAGTLNTTTTPSKTNVAIGETITVTVLLKNDTTDRCYGLPQFRLYIQTAPGVNQDTTNPIFTPAQPQPITLYTSVGPGQSTSATFNVTAARAGSVTFFSTVSVEGTGPGCQPPYFWTSANPSRSTAVVVGASRGTYLPVIGKGE
ncbi:MAG TPA: hypothetical protein VGD58_16165 [Herpetosiphonaceae bacterium]